MSMQPKSYLVSIFVVLLLLGGCGKDQRSGGERVTITFWHSLVSASLPALNELIAKYEAANPAVRIKAQYVPTGDALIQKLVTAVQSRTAPDLSWIHSDFLEDLVSSGAIYQMDHFINGENGLPPEVLEDVYPALRQYASWRDTLYSMPMEATNLALIYNKGMFRDAGLDPEHPPATWDELHDYARRLTQDSDGDARYEQVGFFVPIFPSSGPLGGWMVWQFLPFLWQAGGYLITEDQTRVLYDSEQGVTALTLWRDMYRDTHMSRFSTDADMAFAAGYLTMSLDGPWNLPRYATLLKDLDWAIAPLPAGPEKRATVVGGEYLAIFKQSEHPEETWKFVKWILEPEVQAFWSIRSGYLPVRHQVMQVPEFQEYLKGHPNFRAFVEQMEVAQAQRPIDFHGMMITRHLAEALEKATVGDVDPSKALSEAATKSNRLLSTVQER